MEENKNIELDLSYKSFKEIIVSIVLGFFIGLSVIIPGISGTTIAIVMKVYDKLLYSFANILKRFKVCFIFLLPIGIGVILGFGIGLVVVKLLLERFPFPTICMFVGLMAGTYPIIHKEIKGAKCNAKRVSLFTAGILIPVAISLIAVFFATERELVNLEWWHYLMFMGVGMLISLTQIMPGFSATALLMVMGYYTVLMDSIGIELIHNLPVLGVFGAMVVGLAIGIVMFSSIIQKNLMHHKHSFFYLICGLSLGSMISVFTGPDCMDIYKAWTSDTILMSLIPGILTFAAGFTLTFLLYLYEKKHTKEINETPFEE